MTNPTARDLDNLDYTARDTRLPAADRVRAFRALAAAFGEPDTRTDAEVLADCDREAARRPVS